MDELDIKLNEVFSGKVVRKDLLHRIKKGTNVPTFVLEFLLAKYCASNDEAEINVGMEAVLATLQDNYVRADEANAAQSRVATNGTHRFIDKVHVNYFEGEKRHWASLENFGSQRIAIAHKFYDGNNRMLEGGIWADLVVGHNDIEEDNYAFYIEDLRPVQLSRFDYEQYTEARRQFSRDEWLDIILRSVGLEPSKISFRVKLHMIARLAPLVEQNLNFIELGPRGTGKSYFYSEFSPYSTLVSGGQATKAVLFYNNARNRVGLVGFWDTVAFDEVAGIKVKDPDTIQIMKDYMANGRFSRGAEIIADASFAFVGNLDHSVEQIVNSTEFDLFQPLPKEFDLAVIDRLAIYLPGWEMPKTSSEYLTDNFGLITDYLAEAFHHLFHINRYEEIHRRIRLGDQVEGRDEKAIKKTLSAFLKILHPGQSPSDDYFFEYVEYALESRRRIKEQLNKRKTDGEFAKIDLSYFDRDGMEQIVFCPESKNAPATIDPTRRLIDGSVANGISQTSGTNVGIDRTGEQEFDVVRLIESGESELVEFKSTLRMNLHTNNPDPKMEHAVLKTLAAFLNSNGGTLIIGVSDDKRAVGVETDRFANEDLMSLHLVNIVKVRMRVHAMTYIHPYFKDYKDVRILVLRCDKSPSPVYLKEGNVEKFYIRTGPATNELSMSESVHYIKERFKV